MKIRAYGLHVVGVYVWTCTKSIDDASTAGRLALAWQYAYSGIVLLIEGTRKFSGREEPKILGFIPVDGPLPGLDELLLQVLLRLVLVCLPI